MYYGPRFRWPTRCRLFWGTWWCQTVRSLAFFLVFFRFPASSADTAHNEPDARLDWLTGRQHRRASGRRRPGSLRWRTASISSIVDADVRGLPRWRDLLPERGTLNGRRHRVVYSEHVLNFSPERLDDAHWVPEAESG